MKHCILLSTVFLFSLSVQAQQQQPRLDSMRFVLGDMYVPYFFHSNHGNTTPVRLQPNTGEICFQYQFETKSATPSGLRYQCFLVNVEEGHVATLRTSSTESECNMNIDDRKFTLTLFSKDGKTYSYFNTYDRRRNQLNHYVRTANSEQMAYIYQPEDNDRTLYKKVETRSYCDGSRDAHLYKGQGEAKTLFFLHGSTYPAKLDVINTLGIYGLGFVQSIQGLFICMEMEHGESSFKVIKMTKQDVCFDARKFNVMVENNYFNTFTQEHDSIAHKLDQKEENIQRNSGPCQAIKMELNNFKKNQLSKEKQGVDRYKDKNLYDISNNNMMNEIADINDPTNEVTKMILENEVTLCSARNSSRPNNNRISCLNQKIAALRVLEQKMKEMDRTYAANKGKATMEKAKLYQQDYIMNPTFRNVCR